MAKEALKVSAKIVRQYRPRLSGNSFLFQDLPPVPFFAKKVLEEKPEALFNVFEVPHPQNHSQYTVYRAYSIHSSSQLTIILAWMNLFILEHFSSQKLDMSPEQNFLDLWVWPFAKRNTSHQPFLMKSEELTRNYPFKIYAPSN